MGIDREYMMVNPQDIDIDMPCSAANVKQKKASIQQVGIVQPIVLWLQGLRVIDGFHRTKAAQELGLTEVPAIVVDCNEEAFWDARIQSAKQHADISTDRMIEWIFQSWKASTYATGDDREAFYRFVWDEKLNELFMKSEAKAWFVEKERQWGVDDAAEKILQKAGAISRMRPEHWDDMVSGDLTIDHARILRGDFKGIDRPIDVYDMKQEELTADDIRQYAEKRPEIVSANPRARFPGELWLAERRRERNLKEVEHQKLRVAQETQFYATEQGRLVKRKREMEQVADEMERILVPMGMFAEWDYDFTLAEAIAESPRVKAQVNLVAESCADFWKLAGKHLSHEGLAAENRALREENERLTWKLQGYEAKVAKAKAKRIRSASVLSSTDIEAMPS